MNNDDIRRAIEAIVFIHQLFQSPSSPEEEEITHLLNFTLKRMKKIYEERPGDQDEIHE